MLNDLLRYDPETGLIFWRVNRGRVKAGTQAGYHHKGDNYLYVKIRPNRYPAHRLVWYLHYGEWPKELIDHINGNGMDNRICNLRQATSGENMHNSRTPRSNTSGCKGVCFDKLNNKWMAYVGFQGRFINLGRFVTIEEADAAARAGREKYHGSYHNHGVSY